MKLHPSPALVRAGWAAGGGLLFAVEAAALAPPSGALRAAAAWAWVGLSVLVLAGLLLRSLASLGRSGPDTGWYAAALVLPPALVLFGITGYAYTPINAEAAQQVNEGLARLAVRRDLGLFGVAFLGYPSRQYLLAALPSWWWGRHLATLRLGYGLVYLTGYLGFTAGTAAFLQARGAPRARLLASLAGLLVALGSYPLLYARLFEQTLMPLALALLFLGSLLFFLAGRPPAAALAFMWSLGLMPHAYTPALAAWVLGMVVLAVLARQAPPGGRLPYLAALGYGAVALLTATLGSGAGGAGPALFEVGHYLPQGGGGYADASPGAWGFRLARGLHAVAGIEESLLPAPLAIGVVLLLADGWRRRAPPAFLLVGWAALTVLLALVLKGYWQRVPEFDLHRAMVVLPPLALAVALGLGRPGAAASGAPRLVQGVLVFMILNAVALPWLRRAPRAYYPFAVTDAEEAIGLVLGRGGQAPAVVYLAPPLDFPLETTLAYFCPGTRVMHGFPPAGEHRAGTFVIAYAGAEAFIPEDPGARAEDFPVRFSHPRPYLALTPE